jgi:hypothetical protein
MKSRSSHAGGFALVAALLLLIIAATFTAITLKSAIADDSASSLRLSSIRAEAALLSGLEFGSARVRTGVCQPGPVSPPAAGPHMNGLVISVRCVDLGSSLFRVDVTAATNVPYGRPDFVQRRGTRMITLAPAEFSWTTFD